MRVHLPLLTNRQTLYSPGLTSIWWVNPDSIQLWGYLHTHEKESAKTIVGVVSLHSRQESTIALFEQGLGSQDFSVNTGNTRRSGPQPPWSWLLEWLASPFSNAGTEHWQTILVWISQGFVWPSLVLHELWSLSCHHFTTINSPHSLSWSSGLDLRSSSYLGPGVKTQAVKTEKRHNMKIVAEA